MIARHAAALRLSPSSRFKMMLCPILLLLPHSGTNNCFALGLVNVAPIARPTVPWSVRRHDKYTTLFNSPDATPSDAAAAEETSQKAASPQQDMVPTTTAQNGINNNNNAPLRKGVWMPPSQNTAQRSQKIFSIQQPEDLLNFVVEDERLSVVKVYASWCKTCKVFDLRYRKVASQFGDKYDDKTGTQRTHMGRARFAEMQYDDPNNEEMCKLLNATKLPYILMYKGSQGKVKEFLCGPAKVQLLIDAVNELADPVEEDGVVNENKREINEKLDKPPPTTFSGDDLSAFPGDRKIAEAIQSLPSGGGDTINGLKQQLITLENEKVEMFEIMKAQIESDKIYIKKLETGVETQRSMIEAKDDEISKLAKNVEAQQSILKSKEMEMQTLMNSLNEEQRCTRQAKDELSAYQSQVTQLINKISRIEANIASLGTESSFIQKAATEKEHQLSQKIEEWEEQKEMYERERNSLRKLTVLAVKRVGRGIRSLVSRVKRK